jgi:pimeloyl-ACP methyl ester carboxylesterase
VVNDFRISIADADVADLESRLKTARRPTGVTAEGGIALAEVDALVDYWLHAFDWRAQEAALNRFPQFTCDISGARVHFVHAHNARSSALPLLLLHGWPGSFAEMRHVISDLAVDFHVIVPSLPGFAFSTLPGPGYSNARIADVMAGLMAALGYNDFGVHGGDWDASVGTWLALKYSHRVAGLHLNYIPASYAPFREW